MSTFQSYTLRGFFDPSEISRRRSRSPVTAEVRLELCDGRETFIIRSVTDEFDPLPIVLLKVRKQKQIWEAQQYFQSGTLRISITRRAKVHNQKIEAADKESKELSHAS